MDLDPNEQRVLGCLIEKRVTTPDVYPLSLNALRSASNQSTNRDPVMALGDEDVRNACQSLYRRGLARLASGAGSRTIKYRHLAHEALKVDDAELAVLAVLLLRGPQTIGELRTRTERLHAFESLGEVTAMLDQLQRRELVTMLAREPGRKESRYAHLLGPRSGTAPVEASTEIGATSGPPVQEPPAFVAAAPAASSELEARVAALEARIAALEARL